MLNCNGIIIVAFKLLSVCGFLVESKSSFVENSRFLPPSPFNLYSENKQRFLYSIRGGNQEEEITNSAKATLNYNLSPSYQVPDIWSKGKKRGLVLVDAFCPYHGLYLSEVAREVYGAGVVHVLSNYMGGFFRLKGDPEDAELLTSEMPTDVASLEDWKRKIPFEIVGLICESDAGLEDAEKFGTALNLANHDGVNSARRNKFQMNEACAKNGLLVVKQKLCETIHEARDFARSLGVVDDAQGVALDIETVSETVQDSQNSDEFLKTGVLGRGTNTISTNCPHCIVKPFRGSASDDVFLCKDIHELDLAFETIKGSTVFGEPKNKHEAVLVQEFASGTEYALDTVSKNGEHKIAALWRYDKRPANGAPFVYHATELVDANTETGKSICEYTKKVLDALGISWGMTHTEVIFRDGVGPRLVEVNCRQHNMDFIPLTMAAVGYNTLDMLLSSYLGGENDDFYPPDTDQLRLDWEELPDIPSTRVYGAMVHLVCHAKGTLVGLNMDALSEIAELESVRDKEIYPSFAEVGNPIEPTINIKTDAGWIHLVHFDKDTFKKDYERIVELMPVLFEVE